MNDGIQFVWPVGNTLQSLFSGPSVPQDSAADKLGFPVVFQLIITSMEKPQKTHSFIDNMFN